MTTRYEELTQALRQGGHRLTPQRQAICQHLAESRDHPSPGDVYEHVSRQYPTISLATVYNTLAVLREMGQIVEVVGGADGVRYETHLSPHANLICLNCGRIIDLPLPDLSALNDAIAASSFEMRGLRVDGFGLCAVCRSGGGEEADHA